MAELQRVGGPPSRFDRNLGRILAVAVVAVLIAIAKPWGGVGEQMAIATLEPAPSPSPTPSASSAPRTYDLADYGILEPPPIWEVWSAGTLASYSFALRIDLAPATPGAPNGSAAPAASGASPASDASSAVGGGSVQPSPGEGGDQPIPTVWPVVRIPPGSHLELIAINRPLGRSVDVTRLVRVADDGSETDVEAAPTGSPWPSHVTVVGLAAGDGSGQMRPWPAGRYRMELRIGPEGVMRTLEIVVDTLPAEATPSATPAAPASPAG